MSSGNVSSSQITALLRQLLEGKVSEKIEALISLGHIITDSEKTANTQELIRTYAGETMHVFFNVFKWSFENRRNIQMEFLTFFLNIMNKLFQVRVFLRALPIDRISAFTEEILIKLLTEDDSQHTSSSAASSAGNLDAVQQLQRTQKEEQLQMTQIIKNINSTMLRILENGHPQHIYHILLELLIKYRRNSQNTYSKILGLIVKCILKVTKNIESLLPELNLQELLLDFHRYLYEFAALNPTSDDVGVKTIKTIINELVKLNSDLMLDAYQQVIQFHDHPDQFMHKWITIILKPNQQSKGPGIITPRDLRLERKFSAEKTQEMLQALDGEVRQIIESLKKPESFDKGIQQLWEIIKQHPNSINLESYLKDCSKTFSDHIIAQLDKLNSQQQQLLIKPQLTQTSSESSSSSSS